LNSLYKEVGVSKQAVNQFFKRLEDQHCLISSLIVEVNEIRSEHPGCGVEKMYHMLQPKAIGRDNFISVMMDLGYRLEKPKNGIRTTYSVLSNHYPNLIEGALIQSIDLIWQTDITYFLVEDTYCYLTFIIDVYSRKIVGYCASKTLRAEANIKALDMAFKARDSIDFSNLIHHSDRGSQYTSKEYVDLLKVNHAKISMCKKAPENAYAERINGIIKNEYLKYWEIFTFRKLEKKLKKAVDNYNNKRPHNHLLNRLSPGQFEEKILPLECQERPKVIIYTEGKEYQVQVASSHLELEPRKEPQAHNCPMVYKENS